MRNTIGKGISEKFYFYFSQGFYYFSAGWFFCTKKNVPKYNELNESRLMSHKNEVIGYAA